MGKTKLIAPCSLQSGSGDQGTKRLAAEMAADEADRNFA